MRVFLDTEFTDFADPQLISIGMAAENGRSFYAELSDGWLPEKCSPFTQDVVLPRLARTPSSTLSREESGVKLINWLKCLGNRITVISDAEVDGLLMTGLLVAHASLDGPVIRHQVLCWPGAAMARHFELLLSQTLAEDVMRHNALTDALALRQAILETENYFRNN